MHVAIRKLDYTIIIIIASSTKVSTEMATNSVLIGALIFILKLSF
jgi:hypothetical protein